MTSAVMASTSDLVRSSAKLVPTSELQAEVLRHLDTEFNDLEVLLGRDAPGPSKRGKKRRTLSGEIAQWEKYESQASSEVSHLSVPVLSTTKAPVMASDDEVLYVKLGELMSIVGTNVQRTSDPTRKDSEPTPGIPIDGSEPLVEALRSRRPPHPPNQ